MVQYVVPVSIVVRNRVLSLRSILKTPSSDSFLSHTWGSLQYQDLINYDIHDSFFTKKWWKIDEKKDLNSHGTAAYKKLKNMPKTKIAPITSMFEKLKFSAWDKLPVMCLGLYCIQELTKSFYQKTKMKCYDMIWYDIEIIDSVQDMILAKESCQSIIAIIVDVSATKKLYRARHLNINNWQI